MPSFSMDIPLSKAIHLKQLTLFIYMIVCIVNVLFVVPYNNVVLFQYCFGKKLYVDFVWAYNQMAKKQLRG